MSLSYLTGRRNVHDSPWTVERDAILARLWTEGYSASEIAAQITDVVVSRMAVIGRVHRLKLPPRKPRQRAVTPGRREPRVRIWKPKPRPEQLAEVSRDAPSGPGQLGKVSPNLPPRTRGLSLLELRPTSCRWPIGDGPQWLFCGADAVEGEVYCAAHQRMARVRDKRP